MSLLSITIAGLLAVSQPGNAQDTARDIAERAPDEVWMPVAPENILVMDLPSGQMLIEMRPDLAPGHVDRIRALSRSGFYDGVLFHRVIDGFMAQGGDPTATGQGGSELPDLVGEFARDRADTPAYEPIGRDDRAAEIGFLGTVPVGTQAPTLTEFLAGPTVALWGLHCPGVLSMARAGDPNSANSQFFVMFGNNRDTLDQRYTVWGRVASGRQETRRISRGEPPERPTPLVRARIASDIPENERPSLEVLNPASETFTAYLQKTGAMNADGYLDDVCNATVPVRVNGDIQL